MFTAFLCLTLAADAPAPKVTFDEVRPIFQSRCGACHNAGDRRGGLQLDDYAALMEGGGSGDVVFAGDIDSSYLWMVVNHDEQPVMPPNSPRIPDAELAVIKAWIEQGLLLNAGSKAKKSKPNPALAKVEVTTVRPDGPLRPAAYLGDPALSPARANSVTALAVSPWEPIAAVAGHEQVTLWDLDTALPLGTLGFPEGQPHVLRFSRNGKVLLAAGGRGGARGEAVLWDVVTGERIAKAGNEYDQILAADVSPDLSMVVVGGPKRTVRVHSTADNGIVWETDKHTDWITEAAFSPDGVLLATADRAGGLVVWEAETGREFYTLAGHKGGIDGLAWRADSNVLATASADKFVRLFAMSSGKEVKKFDAGMLGVTALDYSRDGRLLATGVNRRLRIFDAAGKVTAELPRVRDIGLQVAWDDTGNRALVGEWGGSVLMYDAADRSEQLSLVTNPKPLDAIAGDLGKRIRRYERDIDDATKKRDWHQDKIAEHQKAKADEATITEETKKRTYWADRVTRLQRLLTLSREQQAALAGRHAVTQ